MLTIVLVFGSVWKPLICTPFVILSIFLLSKNTSARLRIIQIIVYIVQIIIYIIGLLFIGLIFFIGSLFSEVTTLAVQQSPDQKYEAIAIQVDSGALGGNTIGKLRRNLLLFYQERTVYTGGYREEVVIEWKDNQRFTLDGYELSVDQHFIARE